MRASRSRLATRSVGPWASLRVAVLDDDPDFLAYITDLISNEPGFQAVPLRTPDELYQYCEQELPHILLLDLKMGAYRGEELLARLRTQYPDLCIIVVTGYPSLESMRESFRLQAFDYLAKPFSLGELRQVLYRAARNLRLPMPDMGWVRQRLGQELRRRRREKNLSLKHLASQSGVSISQISAIERGTHWPSLESLVSLCEALDVRPSEIFTALGL